MVWLLLPHFRTVFIRFTYECLCLLAKGGLTSGAAAVAGECWIAFDLAVHLIVGGKAHGRDCLLVRCAITLVDCLHPWRVVNYLLFFALLFYLCWKIRRVQPTFRFASQLRVGDAADNALKDLIVIAALPPSIQRRVRLARRVLPASLLEADGPLGGDRIVFVNHFDLWLLPQVDKVFLYSV